jgi:carotene epsilon-monooxygenase
VISWFAASPIAGYRYKVCSFKCNSHRYDTELTEGHDVVMTSGATIHTRDGMLVTASKRETVAEVAAGDRVDWDTLAPAKDIGKEWLGRGIQVKGEGAGKCPAGMH